jgi:hypothetical protein
LRLHIDRLYLHSAQEPSARCFGEDRIRFHRADEGLRCDKENVTSRQGLAGVPKAMITASPPFGAWRSPVRSGQLDHKLAASVKDQDVRRNG